jgi:hypothetical protein
MGFCDLENFRGIRFKNENVTFSLKSVTWIQEE